jgi:hypothetical protein
VLERAWSFILIHALVVAVIVAPVPVASGAIVAPPQRAPSTVPNEALDALVEAEARLDEGDLDGATAAVERASALAPGWYAPHLTRDRIAVARARAFGFEPATSLGRDPEQTIALLTSGEEALRQAADLAPEDRRGRLRDLVEARRHEIAQLEQARAAAAAEPDPVPTVPPPSVTPESGAPAEPVALTPEEIDRNRRISAEQRKANHMVIAGAATAGVLGSLGLVGSLFFLQAKVRDDEDAFDEEDTGRGDRLRTIGTGLLITGAIGLAVGLPLVVVGSVRKKNAPKRVAKHLRPGFGGLEVRF